MSKLNNAIQKATINSGNGFSGRDRIDCKELSQKYPEGVHVTAIAPKKYVDGDYYHLTCVEEPGKYFSSGKVLTQKCNALLEIYDGDFSELNKDLSKEYLTLFLTPKRGKDNPYIDAGFGEPVPASKFKAAQAEVVDEETGEVIQPAQPAPSATTITQDGLPF